MKITILLALAVALFSGCIGQRAAKVATTELTIQRGTNLYRLSNPKDTSIGLFEARADGTFVIKEYRSTVNEAAIKASQFETEAAKIQMDGAVNMIDRYGSAAARFYGFPVQAAPVAPVAPPAVVPVPAAVSTNAPPK